MKKIYTSIYLTLTLLVLCQAVLTVVKMAKVSGFANKKDTLLTQKSVLLQQNLIQINRHSAQIALNQVANQIPDEYQPISKPIIIVIDNSLASR